MRIGQGTAFSLYQLHANDMWGPWITLPAGDGTMNTLNDAADTITHINGLQLAAASNTTGGYTKGYCDAFDLTVWITPSPSGSWSDTTIADDASGGGGGSANQQVVNSQDFYVWASMTTHANTAGVRTTVTASDTLAEIKAFQAITMWKIHVGSEARTQKCQLSMPSVLRFVKTAWVANETPSGSTGSIMDALTGMMPMAQRLSVSLASKERLSDIAPGDHNMIVVNIGIWSPNSAVGVDSHLAFSTNVVLTQRVRFVEAIAPSVETTVIP